MSRRSPVKTKPDVTGRLLALGLIGLSCLAAWAHQRSRIVKHLSRSSRFTGFLSVRFKGQKDVIPPTLYYLVYERARRSLSLVLVPSSVAITDMENHPHTLADRYNQVYGQAPLTREATLAMGRFVLDLPGVPSRTPDFWLNFELPIGARPSFPREMKRRILEKIADPLFWPRFLAWGLHFNNSEWSGLTMVDLYLGARELRRLRSENIHLSRLPDPSLIEKFLELITKQPPGGKNKDGPATVEVLNATEVPGVALRATKILRLAGFDVVHFGNTRTMESNLRVIDRVGRYRDARSVLETLGCRGSDVMTAMEPKPRADITVILGRDFTLCQKLKKT